MPDGRRRLTERWKTALEHYGMTSTKITPGKSNENGGVEQRHRRTKSAIAQALVLRGSRDFESQTEYLTFARAVVEETHNSKIAERLSEERNHLMPLPSSRIPEYTSYTPKVRCWSTIRINNRTYSVPSRLIGHEVVAHQYAEVVEVYYKGTLVQSMPRLRGKQVHIDYRHIIESLVRKPGAFARYCYREELFPSLVFRRAYDALQTTHGERADLEYVRILHLAARTTERGVEWALIAILSLGQRFDAAQVKQHIDPDVPTIPQMAPLVPDLAMYDALLTGGAV